MKRVVSLILSFVMVICLGVVSPTEVHAKTGLVDGKFYYKGATYSISGDAIYKNNSKIGNLSSSGYGIKLVYGKYLYCSSYDAYKTCIFNLKTKKATYKDMLFSVSQKDYTKWSPCHYKQYYMIETGDGDSSIKGSYILNAKKGKFIKLASLGTATKNRGSKVYYIAQSDYSSPYKLYTCNYKGKNKKALKTLKQSLFYASGMQDTPVIVSATKKYLVIRTVLLGESGHVYKYYYKTKKLKKVS